MSGKRYIRASRLQYEDSVTDLQQTEFDEVLGAEDAPVAAYFWAVKDSGNVDPATDIQGELKGKVRLST